MKPSIAVVICNYNKVAYLKGCLNSLWPAKKAWPAMKVFVVDNASTDGSQDMIRQHYGEWVELIALTENTGGSGGFARGMQAAVASGCEYTALLDNDILLDEDTISLLVDYLQQHDRVGVAGAKICTMDNPQKLQELGAFIDWQRFGVSTPLKGHDDTDSLPDVVNCDYVPACCLVTRTRIIENVGTFDEAHFIYWDDMDWCTRVKQAGHEIHAIRQARVRHKMGAVNATNTFSNYYFERNRLRFFAKYLSVEKFTHFAEKRCQELAQQAFFAYRKGQSTQAVSAQSALLDFAAGNWFSQPDAVLPKAEYSFINQLPKVPFYRVYGENELLCSQVVGELQKNRLPIISDNAVKKAADEVINIWVVEHLLDVDDEEGDYIIDSYFNVCPKDTLNELKTVYQAFTMIFDAVETPVFYRQLITGYQELRGFNAK
ncbi:glycosyltransferase family 2 protein [Alteromonas sp. C1M14]|uniref:glycosyltransferase family 2 protein n=1 Tax=Alteromonas sp. C1M14 TaxID=2841567 RepID=UPI001C083306|nr:glycosyltransferase family 2 protein [Alteromonas sp. C1M14]MBU2977952.1 glycosyltransferase family 2 protein [Alteromonas sp. C1M14]